MAEKAIVPEKVFAEAAVRSVGRESLFEVEALTVDNVEAFLADPTDVRLAAERLDAAGFEVLDVGETTITIQAPAEVYGEAFNTQIVAEELDIFKDTPEETTATYLDDPETEMDGFIDPRKEGANTDLAEVLEGVSINVPAYYHTSPFPPSVGYWHLDVPADVSLGMNADRAHRAGYTGRGVRAVMVDSGWYRHPFFVERGYRATRVVLGPGAINPDHDESGHGTGESANLFAVAPDVSFTMVKANLLFALAAFKVAVRLRPHIISCSWGSHKPTSLSAQDLLLEQQIYLAVRRGITVVFSAGNGQWGFPGQHPAVISAGGVYMHPDGSFEATPYASGFTSRIYRRRISPDVCGLVGLPSGDPVHRRSLGAMYIMLPVEPKDALDRMGHNNGANHYRTPGASPPFGDETSPGDGWAAFSGTSAAAPQLAGVCALMKQACRHLRPYRVRAILKRTARDVTKGKSAQGNLAKAGPDEATGHGLANAFRATMRARRLCRIGPIPIPIPIPRPIIQPIPLLLAEEEELEEEMQ